MCVSILLFAASCNHSGQSWYGIQLYMYRYIFFLYILHVWFIFFFHCIREVEHLFHGCDVLRLPLSNGLVERGRGEEHRCHVFDVPRFPLSNGLVERGRVVEHLFHGCDVLRLPLSNGLVEGGRISEHLFHGCDVLRFPLPNGLVERFRFVEHLFHINHVAACPNPRIHEPVEEVEGFVSKIFVFFNKKTIIV
jgi:hypothetical protein